MQVFSRRLSPLFPVLAILAVGGLFALWPVLVNEGWPYNHEKLSFVWRIRILAQHFSSGDWIPVWSSLDSLGFGSPMPALYHKVFNYLGGGVLLTGASIKGTLIGLLWAFLVVGSAGLYAAARYLRTGPVVAALIALLLTFANYTLTDWLVRGAFAELAAMVLIPWVLLWMLVLVREGRWPMWIGPLLFLLYSAHSVMAYYMVWLLALAFLVHLAQRGMKAGLRPVVAPALASIALFAIPLVPFGLASLHMAGHFDLTNILERGFAPSSQIRPFAWYFADPTWTWGVTWDGLTIQMDRVPLLLAGGGVAFLVWRRNYDISTLFLVFLVVLLLFMQTPAALPLYAGVPGLAYIQFPWRLLAVLTPVLLLLVADLLGRLEGRWPLVLAAGALALSLLGYGGFREMRYDWYSTAELEGPIPADLKLSGIGEYFPVIASETNAGDTWKMFRSWAAAGGAEGPCSVDETGAHGRETLVRDFTLRCPEAGTQRLPLFYAGAEEVVRPDGEALAHYRSPDDPRIAVDLAAGEHHLRVLLPTLRRVLF